MKKPYAISLYLFFTCSMLFAQQSINSYKYVLVPKQFEFQKSADQYQINSLTKFLFERAGFTPLFTDEPVPDDLARNSCIALKVVLNNNSSFLSTKLNIDLFDCFNNLVFSTNEARSREKEYKDAYHEVIRAAFVDIENLKYAYQESVSHEDKKVEKIKIEEVKPAVIVVQPVLKKEEITTKIEEKVAEPIIEKRVEIKEIDIKTIEGNYIIDKWGTCTISKNDEGYSVVGGDENFEFAIVYATSKPNFYIIKWAAYKKPQLVELDQQGNLKVDAENDIKVYKRAN